MIHNGTAAGFKVSFAVGDYQDKGKIDGQIEDGILETAIHNNNNVPQQLSEITTTNNQLVTYHNHTAAAQANVRQILTYSNNEIASKTDEKV